jgi:hypothetical protein
MPESQSQGEEPESQSQGEEPEKADHWFDKRWEPFFERCLKFFEFIIVAGIVLAVVVGLVFEAIWIFFGVPAPVMHTSALNAQDRLQRVAAALNTNWKLGLVLLIPLFYRTVRVILERMEEGPLGTKFPKPKKPTLETAESGGEDIPKREGTK